MPAVVALQADYTDLVIVDPRPQDYGALMASPAARDLLFQFAISASDALRISRWGRRSIWLINIRLPDGSGMELAAAIRARDPHSVVHLVGDEYDPAQEVAARVCGVAMYLCKPADVSWLPRDGRRSYDRAHGA